MGLQIFWFSVIAIFWTGFFVLEGFDLGVGALHAVVGKTDVERRVAINTIGPFWDGNEVWLIVAGAGTFAAFPDWYATWFSALYLALMLVLVALIVRGVSFEFRNKIDTHRWKHSWTAILTVASAALPVLFGIALGDLLAGLPIDSDHEYTGTFWDLFTPFGIWLGITLLSLTLLHGTTFLNLRTTGIVDQRAQRLARPLAVVAIVTVLVLATWTHVMSDRGIVPGPVQIMAVLAIVAAGWSVKDGHDGWAFSATAVAIGLTVATIFIDLYPNVMISSTSSANNLTVANAAAGAYSLKIMSIVAIVLFPIVLVYQGWSYYTFRHRIVGPRAATPGPAPTSPAPPAAAPATEP
jgi:cytochrome d ubiquinol oxidase subunit II